jgi:hypothetical protein
MIELNSIFFQDHFYLVILGLTALLAGICYLVDRVLFVWSQPRPKSQEDPQHIGVFSWHSDSGSLIQLEHEQEDQESALERLRRRR